MSRLLLAPLLGVSLLLSACTDTGPIWLDPTPVPHTPAVPSERPALSETDTAICAARKPQYTDLRQFQAVYLGILQLNGGVPDAKKNALADLKKAMAAYATALTAASAKKPGPMLKAALVADAKQLTADTRTINAAAVDYDGKVKRAVVGLLQTELTSKIC